MFHSTKNEVVKKSELIFIGICISVIFTYILYVLQQNIFVPKVEASVNPGGPIINASIITPTLFCLGSCPTSPSPTMQSSSPSPLASSSPAATSSPAPSQNPCVNVASTGTVHAFKVHKHPNGGLSQLIQLLLQFILELLEKLLGISIPLPGSGGSSPTPVPASTAPSPGVSTSPSSPATSGAPAPTSNPCTSPTATVSTNPVSTSPSGSTQPTVGTPTSGSATTAPTQPVKSSGKHMAIVMYASWFTMAQFQSMVTGGGFTGNDQIKYRMTNYPSGYSASVMAQLKAIKAKIPGIKLGADIAYSANIVKNAAQIKSEGFDFVEYDLEANFDGPNDAGSAASDIAKIQAAANAVHAQGMTFRVTPGRPNSNTFLKSGDLPKIAKMVDYYQIQDQSTQTQGPTVYSSFTAQVTKALKSGNPNIIVTAQVSPGQGAQSGKSVLQTMEDDMTASMNQSAPGNVDGAGMWIQSSGVSDATSFFSWFHKTYQ